MSRFLLGVNDNAEWYTLGLFLFVLLLWLAFLPRRDAPYVQRELNQAMDAAHEGPAKQELGTALAVWTRYENELRTFEYGSKLNWYLYSSLRVLVIALSAITPALIVAPVLANKKFLAALPAAIVAVGTGLIAEFDFRMEAARYSSAQVRLEGEKGAFVTQSPPFYAIVPVVVTTSAAPPSTQPASDAPYAPPQSPHDALANFSYRIEKIYEDEASERDRFLRGGRDDTGGAATKGGKQGR